MDALPSGLRVMAMMLCRNEADVIAECIGALAAWGVPRLAVLDGCSDDGTWETLQDIQRRKLDLGIELDLLREDQATAARFREDKREMLYALARRSAPFDWVISIDADEIYEDSPLEAISLAEADGAQAIMPFIPEFWLTVDDVRNGALVEDERLSVQQRRRWYSWCWRENHIWRERADLHYLPDEQRGVHRDPYRPDGQSWPALQSLRLLRQGAPIQKHYPIRSVRQGIAKMGDRLPRGRRYFGKCAESWIVDEEWCGLARWGGPDWDTSPTQHKVREWYAEAHRRAERRGA